MRSVKLNSATQFVPKYKEEELKMGDKKDYWERPDRYLQKDTSYKKSPDHYAYITVRDGRFVNPDKTWECMPVAYISETGMIKYLNEDVQTIKKLVINYGWGEPEKVPEARDIINEWAVERYQKWWEVRNRHSIEDQLWNITEVGGYVRPICWNRSEGMDVALAARHALNEGVDPAKVAHDYAIVMWCSNYVEKEGYEYPDCADINVSYITKLVQDAFNKGWYANEDEGRTSYTSRFAPKEENEENAVNSSRRSLKTQRAIRHCINSARRRAGLNCSTRYSTKYRVKPNGDAFTLYFISDDGLSNAVFDVDPDFQGACNVEGEILGADANWEIDSYENWFNSSESRDIYELLRYDAEGSTGVDMHECSEANYNASCIAIEQAKKQLNSSRRLNSGKLFYDDATGEYEEYEYDDEQDAWYQLPDEMYIYKLDLSQFTDLVRDSIVSKHEIHEWIDELSEDWGGMPAWSPSKLIDRFEIQDLTKEQYDIWNANFATESVRFRDKLERRY